jgi:hypothetical protein
LNGEHGAGLDRFTVEVDRTTAALAGVATYMRAGQGKLIAQKISKQCPLFNINFFLHAIDCQANFHSNYTPVDN